MVCKYWIELDGNMGLYEYCKLIRQGVICSGMTEECECEEIRQGEEDDTN